MKGQSDEDYILNGIKEGFDILEEKRPIFHAEMENYSSATVLYRDLVEKQLSKEIASGNYVLVDEKPAVVSSLGAIPKSNGSIRLIHDLSRPNEGMNQFVDSSSVKYTTVDEATKHISRTSYLSKLDLKAAYRSVPIKKGCYTYMGLSWLFKDSTERSFFVDTRLPFG